MRVEKEGKGGTKSESLILQHLPVWSTQLIGARSLGPSEESAELSDTTVAFMHPIPTSEGTTLSHTGHEAWWVMSRVSNSDAEN